MTNPLATADFFALEAGECLDRLESLVSRAEGRPADDFLRAARVLRGSALMAGQQPIARAAAGLEAVARAVRDGRRAWDPATREQVAQAVEEFRLLVRRVRDWGEAETARAVRLGSDLESLAGRGRRASPSATPSPGELNTGVRAFVAREGALIASALDRAARSLRATPGDREPLYTVHPPDAVAPGSRRAGRAGAAAGNPRRHRARHRRPHAALRAAARRGRGDVGGVHRPDPHLPRHRRARAAGPRRGRGPSLHRASAARLRRRAGRRADRVTLLRRRPRAAHPADRAAAVRRPRHRLDRSSW